MLNFRYWLVKRQLRAASTQPAEQGIENINRSIALRKDLPTFFNLGGEPFCFEQLDQLLRTECRQRRMQKRTRPSQTLR